MNEIELAWAAGFFDGEGNTNCVISPGHPEDNNKSRNTSRHIVLSVSQKLLAPLERFNAALEIGTILGPYESQGAGYRWQVNGPENVKFALERLRPFLTHIKIDQCEDALKKYYEWEPIAMDQKNYTYEQCPHCNMKTRPGPLKRHMKKAHSE